MSSGSPSTYWVDTNILVRFLVGEPEGLAARAERIIARANRKEMALRVHPVCVAEVVWVLGAFYGHTARDIAGSLVPLLSDYGLKVEGGATTVEAINTMASANVDFADALLAEISKTNGEGVASFDADFPGKLGVEPYRGQ